VVERIFETKATRFRSWRLRLLSAPKLRGAARQRGRHRRETACVRAPSLVGRREMTVPRTLIGELANEVEAAFAHAQWRIQD
jgi:hypothetical protein